MNPNRSLFSGSMSATRHDMKPLGRLDSHHRKGCRPHLVTVSLVLSVVLSGCGGSRCPDIVLICLDSFRADHFTPGLTPNLWEFGNDSVVFHDVVSNAPWTTPSIASVFTGAFPTTHGLNDEGHRLAAKSPPIAQGLVTLAEALEESGYTTAAYVTHGPLAPQLGFDRGFDEYIEVDRVDGSDIKQIVDLGLRLLSSAESPIFLYLHSFEPHLPDVTGSYAGDIARMDSELGRFLEAVQRRNALIAVFSDHGEDPSRASRRHGFDLKQDLLSVPLIVRDGLHAGVVSDPAQLVDLMPTILEFVDVRIPGSVQGRSLLPALRGEGLESTLIVSEAPFQGSSWFSARRGEFKLVFRPVEDSSSDLWWWDEVTGPHIALYNLALDPNEKSNVFESEKKIALSLLAEMAELRSGTSQPTEGESDMLERLRSLGYLD